MTTDYFNYRYTVVVELTDNENIRFRYNLYQIIQFITELFSYHTI